MIDFFASATIALIIIMTIVLFLSNWRQAQILKQMRGVVEDWYDAQMRDRRLTYREKIDMPDVLEWLGKQADLTVVEQARKLEDPPAIEFLTAEGSRLVISPLKKFRLRAELRSMEGKRRKVSKLVQPLLGYRPGKAQVIQRSNDTVHEWYEVEIETALQKLGVDWGRLKGLNFYIVPQEAAKEKAPWISFDFSAIQSEIKKRFTVKAQPVKEVKGEIKKESKKPGPKTKRKKTTTKQVAKPLAAEMKGGKK